MATLIPFWKSWGFPNHRLYIACVMTLPAIDRQRIMALQAAHISANLATIKERFTNFYDYKALTLRPGAKKMMVTKRYSEKVKTSIDAELAAVAPKIIARAQQLTPKLTGNLSRGYTYTVTGQSLRVFNTVSYFPYIEREVGMLRQALNEYQPIVEEIIIRNAQNLARVR